MGTITQHTYDILLTRVLSIGGTQGPPGSSRGIQRVAILSSNVGGGRSEGLKIPGPFILF